MMKLFFAAAVLTLSAILLTASIFGGYSLAAQNSSETFSGEQNAFSPQTARPNIERSIKNNVIISKDMPPIRIKVDKKFKYAGNIKFNIKNIAAAERFVFIKADNRKIKSMFIVQFEGFLDGVNDYYKYSLPNPVTLGRNAYRSNVWFYNNAQEIRENPGAESDQTTKFLNTKGFQNEDEMVMSRFARPVGETKKHEILIFYFENLKDTGFAASDFDSDSKPVESKKALENEFTKRARESFSITDL